MERPMIVRIGGNIVSPLGLTARENYEAVKSGRSALRLYEGRWGLPEPFVGSLFEDGFIDSAFSVIGDASCYTAFEKALILSVAGAVAEAGIDASSSDTLFIVSTTKGNVSLLDDGESPHIGRERLLLGCAAETVCRFFGNPRQPLVVSNACISGVCAQVAAMRMLESGACRYAIVAGCDIQSKFIVSGFQSFKALSSMPCRPYDKGRDGLNLGEAAATIIYARTEEVGTDDWTVCKAAVRNDANHISGPSRTGEGSFRALRAVVSPDNRSRLAFINAHGTATAYNDEMESIAIMRAGLSEVPVNGLKGYYGHTMGAAGLLETLVSMYAIDDATILGTRGYSECGVSHPLDISPENRSTERRAFVKLLSGFGGCNAALLLAKGGEKW